MASGFSRTVAAPVEVRRGLDMALVYSSPAGDHRVPIGQGERVEVQLPALDGAVYAGYQVVNGERRPLPMGSSLDATKGINRRLGDRRSRACGKRHRHRARVGVSGDRCRADLSRCRGLRRLFRSGSKDGSIFSHPGDRKYGIFRSGSIRRSARGCSDLEANPDVARSGVEPLTHYLDVGGREGRDPHVLFDTAWYLAEYGDACRHAEGGPLGHYLQKGWRAGARPNRWFSPSDYRRRYPDVATAGMEPLEHYLRYGIVEGRDPRDGGGGEVSPLARDIADPKPTGSRAGFGRGLIP